MTQARACANWSGVPSLNQLWLVALLRMLAMLWSNVVATFRTCPAVADLSRRSRKAKAERRRRMNLSLLAGDWHTDVKPGDLPGETHDICNKETNLAAGRSDLAETLILRAGNLATLFEAELAITPSHANTLRRCCTSFVNSYQRPEILTSGCHPNWKH